MIIETMFVSVVYAALVGIFTMIAFNRGVEVGKDMIVLEELREEEDGESGIEEIKRGKVYTIATDEDKEDGKEDWDRLDEAQKVEKIRQRIEDERVNKFFD